MITMITRRVINTIRQTFPKGSVNYIQYVRYKLFTDTVGYKAITDNILSATTFTANINPSATQSLRTTSDSTATIQGWCTD